MSNPLPDSMSTGGETHPLQATSAVEPRADAASGPSARERVVDSVGAADRAVEECVLPDALSASVRVLRHAMGGAIADVGGNPAKPRELARHLKLDKTLAWKIARMVGADSDREALQYLPGDAAMDLFLNAMGEVGTRGSPAVAHARQVVAGFREHVSTHIGDRPTLDIVLDALPGQQASRFLNSRKLAFRGNSGIWGVQAKARVQAAFFFPSPRNPDLIDIALVAGWVDFRRLRRDAKWVLFRHSFHEGAGRGPSHAGPHVGPHPGPHTEPLDPWDQGTSGLNFLREFCSDPAPRLRPSQIGDEMHYQLADGPVGNAGVFTCFMGSITRGVGKLRGGNGELGRVGAMISAPVENIQFDLYLHKDIPLTGTPTVEVVSGLTSVAEPNESDLLPLEEKVEPVNDTSASGHIVPRYSTLLSRVHQMLQLAPSDFRGYRYALPFPPFPSTVRLCIAHGAP